MNDIFYLVQFAESLAYDIFPHETITIIDGDEARAPCEGKKKKAKIIDQGNYLT